MDTLKMFCCLIFKDITCFHANGKKTKYFMIIILIQSLSSIKLKADSN